MGLQDRKIMENYPGKNVFLNNLIEGKCGKSKVVLQNRVAERCEIVTQFTHAPNPIERMGARITI
jgi:hypothetical protein